MDTNELQLQALKELWEKIPAETILAAGKAAGKLKTGYTVEDCDCCGPEFIEDKFADDWRIK
jgi:hypothetical protein